MTGPIVLKIPKLRPGSPRWLAFHLRMWLGRHCVRIFTEPRDVWIGYYRGPNHHYVCPLPCLVVRWPRR